jgi:ATP-dependent protease HslVU (ClpYQ) peptidase subunit
MPPPPSATYERLRHTIAERSAAQEMTADEISILAEDNSTIAVGNGGNHAVGAAISIWQIKGVQDVASQSLQRPNKRSRQLGIQQDPHAERRSTR